MAKQIKEILEIDIADFDDETAMVQFSKHNMWFTANLDPDELQELALQLLQAKTQIEMLRKKSG